MNKSWPKILFSLVCLLYLSAQMIVITPAQIRQTTHRSTVQLGNLAERIRIRFDNFRASFDTAIENIRLRGDAADEINRSIEDFETSLNIYVERLNSRQANAGDVQAILDAATQISDWLRTTRLNAKVDRDWSNVKLPLNQLASEYNLSFNSDSVSSNRPNNSIYPNDSNSVSNSRLSGTYRLDASRSDNPSEVANRAVYQLPNSRRNAERDTLAQRLETPELLAIEQRGQQVTIASSRAPRYTFTADGREKIENGANGTTLRVRASVISERLEVITLGDRDNDYSVIFELTDYNRSLRVTRRISTDFLQQPVIVTSIYERTSEIAQLDIYERPNSVSNNNRNNSPNDNRLPNNRRDVDYAIANNTTLRAVLNESISTKTANENDRFTMTVQTPDEYRGAVIEGYVSGINRSGRVSGRANLTFNFERIRLNNGRTYDFAGFVESVRNKNGDEIKVNNEGNVQGENQTKQTATRGAVGAAVGALIGAIAGGGKGAAIGAIIGGGAGAGSVYIEGREDLEINSGSDVYIRASAPAR